jgi:glycosyltransferase involved in cell wall biosynthesis
MIRVLQVVKTSTGAQWAAWQAAELVSAGVDVHVALPDKSGLHVSDWEQSGAKIHVADLNLPLRRPWLVGSVLRRARHLVDSVQPDIIHSHFVSTTLTLRKALGSNHPIPRFFQIPGPLHLEHALPRALELSSAGESDYWIASSRCIADLLRKSGIAESRIFLSYYGWPVNQHQTARTYELHDLLGVPRTQHLVGNISWFYKRKRYLGQKVGLKCHEDIIEALAIVTRKRSDVTGVLIGAGFNGAHAYEQRLRAQAARAAGSSIRFPGALNSTVIRRIWPDMDCAVHVPLSENCGGVIEPLCTGVPAIASRVGGLPEVVIDGLTGTLVPPRSPAELARATLDVLENLPRFREHAQNGRALVSTMFDVQRTAREIHEIYKYLLQPDADRPVAFDSRTAAQKLRRPQTCGVHGAAIQSMNLHDNLHAIAH